MNIAFFSAGLPQSTLGRLIENRVNDFLKTQDSEAGYVTIRIVSSVDKAVDVKPGMKARYVITNIRKLFENHPDRKFIKTLN